MPTYRSDVQFGQLLIPGLLLSPISVSDFLMVVMQMFLITAVLTFMLLSKDNYAGRAQKTKCWKPLRYMYIF